MSDPITIELQYVNCDAGRALLELVDLLVQANMQEDDEDGGDEEYIRKTEAETRLFVIASERVQALRETKEALDG